MSKEALFIERREPTKAYNNIPDDLLRELIELGITKLELKKIDTLQLGARINGQIRSVEWNIAREKDGTYTFYTGEGSGTPDSILAARAENQVTRTAEDRAKDYWAERLKNEKRIDKPQDPMCEFVFVIPVYDEKSDRVLRQLDSFRHQKGILKAQFEIIYVVNNDVVSDDTVRKQNQIIIQLLKNISDLNVLVIDKSSKGNEIQDCNVGRARNRGLAEASSRFYENGKNGVVIQIDADTNLSDDHYLSKLTELCKDNPEMVEVIGEVTYEFNPDTMDDKEEISLEEQLHNLILAMKRKYLIRFLLNPNDPKAETLFDFSIGGAHMVSKSLESAAIGGFLDTNIGEDNQFMNDLAEYAQEHDKKVVPTNELRVTTALRDSDRTMASFGKNFAGIVPDENSSDSPIMNEVEELERKVLQLPHGKTFISILDEKMKDIRLPEETQNV